MDNFFCELFFRFHLKQTYRQVGAGLKSHVEFRVSQRLYLCTQIVFSDIFLACMFLEDSAVGREVWRTLCVSMLKKISDLFPVLMQDKCLSDGPLCYLSVKVFAQITWMKNVFSGMWITDLKTVTAAGVPASIPAAVQWSSSSGVEGEQQQSSGAENPAGSHEHNTRTGFFR